jgi:hypothetical protein
MHVHPEVFGMNTVIKPSEILVRVGICFEFKRRGDPFEAAVFTVAPQLRRLPGSWMIRKRLNGK